MRACIFFTVMIFFTGIVYGGSDNALSASTGPTNDVAPALTNNAATGQNTGLNNANVQRAKLMVCADYLWKNKLSETPYAKCEKLYANHGDCVSFLEENGIGNSETICNRFFIQNGQLIKERNYVSNVISDQTDEARLKRIDRISEKYPAITAKLQNLDDAAAKVYLHLSRADQVKIAQMDADTAASEIAKYTLRVVKKENLYRARAVAQAKVNQAKNTLARAKEHYNNAKNAFENKKQLFDETKLKLENCEENGDCEEVEEEIRTHAQGFVQNSATMLIEHLKKIKSSVESSEEIDEETASEIINSLDETIKNVEEEIETIKTAATKEEVIEASKRLHAIWLSVRHKEKLWVGKLYMHKIKYLIKRAEDAEAKVDAAIARLEEQGIEVSHIEEKSIMYSEKVASAKEDYEKAVQLISSATLLSNKDEVVDEVQKARVLLRSAHKKIQEASKILKDIIKDIRQAGGSLDAEISDDVSPDEAIEVVEVSAPHAT